MTTQAFTNLLRKYCKLTFLAKNVYPAQTRNVTATSESWTAWKADTGKAVPQVLPHTCPRTRLIWEWQHLMVAPTTKHPRRCPQNHPVLCNRHTRWAQGFGTFEWHALNRAFCEWMKDLICVTLAKKPWEIFMHLKVKRFRYRAVFAFIILLTISTKRWLTATVVFNQEPRLRHFEFASLRGCYWLLVDTGQGCLGDSVHP